MQNRTINTIPLKPTLLSQPNSIWAEYKPYPNCFGFTAFESSSTLPWFVELDKGNTGAYTSYMVKSLHLGKPRQENTWSIFYFVSCRYSLYPTQWLQSQEKCAASPARQRCRVASEVFPAKVKIWPIRITILHDFTTLYIVFYMVFYLIFFMTFGWWKVLSKRVIHSI